MSAESLVVSEVFGPTVQGEGPTLGRRAGFVRLGRCNLACEWCFAPETPVLMADWTWKELGTVDAGDLVMSFKDRRYSVSRVLGILERKAPIVRVSTDAGDVICTEDHVFHVNHHLSGRHKAKARDLVGLRIKRSKLGGWDDLGATADWWRGYLQGALAGDGYCSMGKERYPKVFWQVTDRDFAEAICSAVNQLGAKNCRVRTAGRPTVAGKAVYRVSCTLNNLDFVLDLPLTSEQTRGYVAGFFDAEGTVATRGRQLAMSQKDDKVLVRVASMLEGWNFDSSIGKPASNGVHSLVINGVENVDRFMSTFSPRIARKRVRNRDDPRKTLRPVLVRSVKPIGTGRVLNLTTTTGNFFAGGFLVDQCDTPYTWQWENFDPAVELQKVGVEEVLTRLDAMSIDMVVVSGGEPMLQQRALEPLLRAVKDRGWRVEIETAGTVAPAMAEGLVDQWNVSPKLANSGNPWERRYKPDVLRAFEASGRAIFKFVVCELSDLDEVQAMVDECELTDVWIMPEGTDAETLEHRSATLADDVIKRGWNLTTRLHILIWGNRRGV